MSFLDAVMDRFARLFVPIHPDGHRFIAIAVVATLVLLLISDALGWIALILTAWLIFFFRAPERIVPLREGLVVSAADGTVISIEDVEPASELDLGAIPHTRVSVHLSLFDGHIQRAPIAGTIAHTVYMPGTFRTLAQMSARLPKQLVSGSTIILR